MKTGIIYEGGTFNFSFTMSCSLFSGILIEQDKPSAVAAKKMFSITHQMVANGFYFETYSPFNSFDLKSGITTYGASFNIVYCLGIA